MTKPSFGENTNKSFNSEQVMKYCKLEEIERSQTWGLEICSWTPDHMLQDETNSSKVDSTVGI